MLRSYGKGTRHINIRYFFITDRIARKEIAIQYCPTKEMVPDYFTKPLQGAQSPWKLLWGAQECVGWIIAVSRSFGETQWPTARY
jgi:hypothetical protein